MRVCVELTIEKLVREAAFQTSSAASPFFGTLQ
jgi:hypothetical protein